MISINDMRPGQTVELDGKLYAIVERHHIKPGKGHAFVRTRLKDLRTGAVRERTFRPDERVNQAVLDKREMQYLYEDDAGYVFMDNETYEQTHVEQDLVGEGRRFLTEGITCFVPLHAAKPVGIELPVAVELEIAEAEPGVKGDRVSGAVKAATLETGAVVQVPLFLDVGDRVKVDTRTGEYISRA